jgi:ketosteroid isomerase-like protein
MTLSNIQAIIFVSITTVTIAKSSIALGQHSQSIQQEITKQWSIYVDAAKRKDAETSITIWTPDTRLLSDPGGAEDIRTSEAYRQMADEAFKTLSVAQLEIDSEEITILSEDTALEIGKWMEEYVTDATGASVVAYGAYMAMWKLTADGNWKIHRFIRNRHDIANPTFEEALGN